MLQSFQTEINKFPKEIIDKLKNTQQDLKYHPEGNVYNHIWLVYNSISLFFKKTKLNNTEILKNDLLICALFHDLGKIECTREKEIKDGSKKLVAYGHEYKSLEYLDRYLDLFEHHNKEMIYEVCKNHMRAHLLDKMREFKKEEFKKNRYYAETVLFSSFDDTGKNQIPNFIMTVGIPGSGKSTWVKEQKDYVVICPDNIRKTITGDVSNITRDDEVWGYVLKMVKLNLELDMNVILDATNTISKNRRRFLKELPLCFTYAKIFESNPAEAIIRIRQDLRRGICRSNVPDSIVFKMFNQFEKDKDKFAEDGLEVI